MTDGNSRFGFTGCILLLTVTLTLVPAAVTHAQQEDRPERERPEVTPTTAEVVAAIKRRAQQILEERRKARQLRFSGEISQLIGYESNPANSVDHVGDTYLEQSLYLNASKKLTPTLTWAATYSGSYDNYVEYGDGDYMSHTLTPAKLTWQPGRMWRVEGGADLNITYYPRSKPSNYREFKPFVQVRQNLGDLPRLGSVFHLFRYEWFIRDYLTKKARDGASAETFSNRVDARHRLRYEVGSTWNEMLLKVKQELYWHDSNDARNDFYDAQDYKVTASVNRPLTDKLSANASYAFERKDYEHRPVTGNVTAEARYDDTQTWTLQGTYDLNKSWSFTPKFEYKFLDSNEPTGEYIDTTISGTLTARF